MRILTLLVFLSLALLPFTASATPMVLSGNYLTALADEPQGTIGEEYLSVPFGFSGQTYLSLSVDVTPRGGMRDPLSGQRWYEVLADVALNIFDSAGVMVSQITLGGFSQGPTPGSFNLFDSVLLESAPASFELYLGGHDARLEWTLFLTSAGINSLPSTNYVRAIPEPATVFTLGLAGLWAMTRRKGSVRPF